MLEPAEARATESGRQEEACRWLVDVALPVPLRRHFTYRLPEHWDPNALRAGQRVLVPFREKLLHGVTLVDPYFALPDAKTRALVSFDGEREVLSAEIRNLLTWLVKYYRVPVGEAVRLALPPGVLSEDEIEYGLSEAGEAFVASHPEERRLVLLRGRRLNKAAWEALCQTQIALGQIRSWEDEGLLEVGKSRRERETVPYVSAVGLTAAGREADPAALMRAPRQRELLEFVRQRKSAIAWESVLAALPQAGSALTALVKRGFLEKLRLPKHELETRLEGLEVGEIRQLTDEQTVALAAIERSLAAGRFHSLLLFGVTGAGKTEVYLRAIQTCLARGRQALFLVPEIALTPMMQRRIEERFGERLAILHSAVGAGKRNEAWARVLAGKVDLVLGARSCIFAPLPRLGLVIVDEEHDGSYKQNDGVRYHARDLALVRAKMADATVILGSATPSLESWHNCELGRHELLTIRHRATNALLPTMTVVDMREEFKQQRKRPIFSRLLIERMRETLERGQQIMVLLNRRGYHSFLMCRKCGVVCMCSQCEVSLTYHRQGELLKCHYCDETQEVPRLCGGCGAERAMMQFFGEGTQQIEELMGALFPAVAIGRLDRDQMTSRHSSSEILERFERGETRILVGTQMIAKGHDFPKVTLVGILNADQGLRLPDFRSAETVFQLLTQVSGRSGRGQDHGSVVVQTYMPEHYAIECATRHDYLGFLEKELRYRKHLFYSPYSHMVNILITYKDEAKAHETAEWLAKSFRPLTRQMDLVVLGPTRAPVARIKNQFRYQILLKSAERLALHNLADQAIIRAVELKMLPATAILLDIDPYFFG